MALTGFPLTGGGTTIDDYADWASLPSDASDGDIARTTDTGALWVYNDAASLWLPPDVQPTSLVADYDPAVDGLPTAATPAWTKNGAASAAVVGGVLVLTGTAADTVSFKLVDAVNLASTNDIGVIVRERVTSTDSGDYGWRSVIALRAGEKDSFCLATAFDAPLGDPDAVNIILDGGSGPRIFTPTTAFADNSAWNYYLITHRAAQGVYTVEILGAPGRMGIPDVGTGHSWVPSAGILWGNDTSSKAATIEVSTVKVFTF